MYIKRYTIASFILIALVGWYVFAYITQDTMSVDLFGIVLPSLSTALWVIAPLIILYIASVVHMWFYSFLGSLSLRKYEKDYDKLIDSILEAYLGKKDRKFTFKTPRYKLIGSLVDNTTLFPTQQLTADSDNEKINAVVKLIEDIKNGSVVDLKKYALKPTNALVIQNERNRYKKGDIKAEDILNNFDKYDRSLCQEVYIDFAKKASIKSIEKYNSFLTKDALFEILSRINSDENSLEVSNDTLIALFKTLELDKKDYLNISSALALGMVPDQRIKLFETISNEKEEAMDAYLFTLFDLEMLAPADEILETSQQDEYLNFKAYRALKECNKHFNINLFI
ncbi:MAG: hypothetical protein U9Q29_02280 [Campylobacterota bacterium]|nr:hypothetical protein [Campylobacterota bacterium]